MNINSTNDIQAQILATFPPEKWTSIRTLVAVSGGPDSVALLRILLAIGEQAPDFDKQNLLVGHVNHQLRGPDSDEDEKFVRELARSLGLDFCSRKSSERPSTSSHQSPSEETLRDFRYDKLLELSSRTGARYLVTGHNFDDQVETILFRIFRGTGISGLAGIPRLRLGNESVTIVRPMLDIRRSEIEAYLDDIGQGFQVDHSNSQSDYTRNFLRNELLPLIKTRFESAPNSIARLGAQAAEVDRFLNQKSKELLGSIVNRSANSVEIDCQKLDSEADLIVIRQFIVQIWKLQKWPLQSMTFWWLQRISVEVSFAALNQNKFGNSETAQDNRVLNLPNSIRFESNGQIATFTMVERVKEGGL